MILNHDHDEHHHGDHDVPGGHQQVRLDVDRGRHHDASLLLWKPSGLLVPIILPNMHHKIYSKYTNRIYSTFEDSE